MPLAHRLTAPSRVRLADINPSDTQGISKEDAKARIETLGAELTELESLLYAAGQNSLLIVLQGMDTSGKDGTLRTLLRYLNAQGTTVASFKVPTPEELSHDFLWRIHPHAPAKGATTLFNRSHYEDVLVVRVHSLVPEPVWKARYDHINAFESLLTTSGTLILKFFLHITKDEQEQRLLEREQEVEKAWKLSVGDWKERAFWNDYQAAYEDVLSKTAAPHAPWHVIPANKKWFRDLCVLEAVTDALRPHAASWTESLADLGKVRRAELEEFRRQNPS